MTGCVCCHVCVRYGVELECELSVERMTLKPKVKAGEREREKERERWVECMQRTSREMSAKWWMTKLPTMAERM